MKLMVITAGGEEKKSYSSYLIQLLIEIFRDHAYTEQTDLAAAQTYAGKSLIIIKTTSRSSFSVRWWYRVVLTSFIHKVKPNLIIHLNGCYKTGTNTPQIFGITDIAYLNQPDKILSPRKKYSKKNFPSFIQQANSILSYTKSTEDFLTKNFHASAQKITVIPPAVEEAFFPLEWGEKQLYKLQYTDAKEFFLVNRNFREIDQVLALLKAFSVFKKWQHSSMKLMIAGNILDEDEWQQKLSSYRFKNDVIVLENLTDYYYDKMLASAYAFLHLPLSDSDIIPALEAVYCRTPVISYANNTVDEMMGASFLTAQKDDFNELGQKMILLYKDESLRDKMINEAEEKIKMYKREDALLKMRNMVEQVANN